MHEQHLSLLDWIFKEIRRILRRQQMQQEKQQQQPQEKAAAAQNSKPAKPPTKAVAQPANEVTKKVSEMNLFL